uniref:DsrH/TusB family sulfur metabolism protein n=1 Tax=uncultured Acinetobacter sp. TaxID=165433 RepID=UPI00262EB2E7|nr:DsrH/TusB family sulfur metabolism protein [uncultured Acinetobacter sp.]
MKEKKINQLFILQASYHRLEHALFELANIATDQDAVLLLEDAVLAQSLDAISHVKAIFILSADADAQRHHNTAQLQFIDYADWAELLQHSQKVHTWQ